MKDGIQRNGKHLVVLTELTVERLYHKGHIKENDRLIDAATKNGPNNFTND